MLTPEEVRHVAMLARLGLSDQEVETMQVQMAEVLDYIAMLEQIDTSQIPPTAQILSHLNVARNDKPWPSLPLDLLLSNAPAAEESFLKVPAVLEEARDEGGKTEAANA